MINNMEGKTYEERLHCLKLRTLEERRNELLTLDDNISGTRGHAWKLAKFWCTWDCYKYVFSNKIINRCNQLDQRVDGASSINAFKKCLAKYGKQGRTSSWTDPLSSRPSRCVFLLVTPHKVTR